MKQPVERHSADPADGRIAFVVATDFERRFVQKGVAVQRPAGKRQDRLAVVNCGIGCRDLAALERMANIRCVVSTGFAAGLDPELAQGTLLMPGVVIGPDGDKRHVCRHWHDRIGAVLKARWYVNTGPLVQVPDIVRTPPAKKALHRTSEANSADMESADLADLCTRLNWPFVVLRAVADPAHATIPRSVAAAAADGAAPEALPLARALVKTPADWWPFIALLRYVFMARRSLTGALGLSTSVFLETAG